MGLNGAGMSWKGLEIYHTKTKKNVPRGTGGGGWRSVLGRILLYINPPYKKFPPYGSLDLSSKSSVY